MCHSGLANKGELFGDQASSETSFMDEYARSQECHLGRGCREEPTCKCLESCDLEILSPLDGLRMT